MNIINLMNLRKHAMAQAEEPRPEKIWGDEYHKNLEALTVITINERAHGQED